MGLAVRCTVTFAQFQNLVIQIASGLGLIALAKTVVELCMTMVLPNKDKYKLWSHETSPDFETDNEDEMHTFHYEVSKRELREARILGITGADGKTPRGRSLEECAFALAELQKKEDEIFRDLVGRRRSHIASGVASAKLEGEAAPAERPVADTPTAAPGTAEKPAVSPAEAATVAAAPAAAHVAVDSVDLSAFVLPMPPQDAPLTIYVDPATAEADAEQVST